MNGIDLTILVLLGLFLGKGIWRGLIRELCGLLGIALGVFLAWQFSLPLGNELAQRLHLAPRPSVLLVGVMLFGVGVLAFFILGFYLGKLTAVPIFGGLNRLGGGLLGLLEGVVVLAVVLHVLAVQPYPRSLGAALSRAQLAPPFIELGGVILRDGAVGNRPS